MKNNINREFSGLEEAIGYQFKNGDFLSIATTHSSYANEMKKHIQNNERQEFLGDSVLSFVVSDYLFGRFRMAEGDLTRLRASIVCEKALCDFARSISLGSYLRLGRGELQTGGADRPSILADAFEALIAAIYLDGGLEPVRNFILSFVKDTLESESQGVFEDYKTLLQEIVQQNPQEILKYVLVDESGPDHEKCFEVEVLLNSNIIGRGTGRSKKGAEQSAAKEALRLMGK